uniref:Ubiquitin-like domain-containing protein n=1 Tax=Parascaris univalens TaxID=6257 RepID=A0A914ZE31_PARUN
LAGGSKCRVGAIPSEENATVDMGDSRDKRSSHNIKRASEQKPRVQYPLSASREELQSRSSDLIPRKSAEVGEENKRDSNSSSTQANNGSSAKSVTPSTSKKSMKQPVEECTRPFTSPTGHSPICPVGFAIYIPRTPESQSSEKSNKGRRKALKSKSDSRLSRTDMIEITVKSTMSSFKPLRLAIRKSTSVRALKSYIQTRTGIASVNTSLVFNNKELKDDMATLSSLNMGSKNIIWVVIRPISGNNDREEIAALLRMSQSLSTLRHIIRSMPSVDMDYEKNTPPEYSEAELFVSKEKEHELMRQRMRMLKERRRKNAPNSVLLLEKTAKEERGARPSFDGSSKTTRSPSVEGNREEWSPADEQKSASVQSDTSVNMVDVSPVSPNMLSYDPVPITSRELALYFDPLESLEELEIINDEMFDPPRNEEQLQQIQEEIHNARCGTCRIKLPIAMREMRCYCGQVFCKRHRNPQDHRCSIDRKSVDRERLKKTLPKLDPRAKLKQ